jgi:hypothetical protein
MQLPSWLAGLTGADKFANNPANGFQANLGDLAQAAGHSLLQHYRGKGGTYGGNPIIEGLNGGPGTATPLPQPPAETLANILPSIGGISGGPLAPAENAQLPFAGAELIQENQPPAPAPMDPQARSMLTAALNGGGQQPWGQLPAALQGIPPALLLRMGLRGF